MSLAPTMSGYFGRQYMRGVGFCLLGILGLVFLFDLIELLRRASGREEATFLLVLQMAVLKAPALAQKVLPFGILFGAMATFTWLTRTNELIVARAAGFSVWRFLTPAIVLTFALGVFVVTVFNPVAATMVSRFEQLEVKYLDNRASLLAVKPTGLWLRQVDATGSSVVHARTVTPQSMELDDVIVFLYSDTDSFSGRIDAPQARLEPGRWVLRDALLTRPDEPGEKHTRYEVPTTLTYEQIQESFASPETLSFWALPGFIETLEATGFTAQRHRLHWHSVMALPVLLTAMVLIAASFSLRLTRHGHVSLLVAMGVMTGFGFYFLADVVHALGAAGDLPVTLAAWAPAGIMLMAGGAMLLHLEDG